MPVITQWKKLEIEMGMKSKKWLIKLIIEGTHPGTGNKTNGGRIIRTGNQTRWSQYILLRCHAVSFSIGIWVY